MRSDGKLVEFELDDAPDTGDDDERVREIYITGSGWRRISIYQRVHIEQTQPADDVLRRNQNLANIATKRSPEQDGA